MYGDIISGMKIKTLFIVILICLSVLFCSCEKETVPAEMPADFDFIIVYQHAFIVDTYKDTLTETDLYNGDVIYDVRFDFTDEQMENIYSEFVKRNLHKIEDGTDVGPIRSVPPVGVYFTYTSGGKTLSINCSDVHLPKVGGKEKLNFVEFTDFIIAYIVDSEQYQDAPHIFYGWE